MSRTRPARPAAPIDAAPPLMTAAELLTYHDPYDRRTELVRGRLVVHEPPGGEHARVLVEVGAALLAHVKAAALASGKRPGIVVGGDPGCWIERDPDTVRAPDVAYMAADRLPPGPVHGFFEGAPTLAVEVLSPSDRRGAVAAKVAQWLAAGTVLVWTIDPIRRFARVHRADGSTATIDIHGTLDGEGVLPGFVLPLASLFD